MKIILLCLILMSLCKNFNSFINNLIINEIKKYLLYLSSFTYLMILCLLQFACAFHLLLLTSEMSLLKPFCRSLHSSVTRPVSVNSHPSPSPDTSLVDKAIAVLKGQCTIHLNSLAPQFTPESASELLVKSQFDKILCLQFIAWSRRRRFFTVECKCVSLHILTRFKVFKTAQTIAAEVAVVTGDDGGGFVFQCLKDSYFACNSSSAVFDLVVKSYSQLKMINTAMNIIHLVKSNGFMPSVLAYNSVLHEIIRASSNGHIDLAQKLYEDMISSGISPNVYTYNILIRCFCSNGNIEKGLQFFDKMAEKGCLPNVVTYNTLIDSYCKMGKISEAFKLLKDMSDRNLEPSLITYNMIINGLCKEGRMKETSEVLDELKQKGLTPNEITYNTLINGYCREGNFHQALVLHSDMLRNGLSPCVVTYTSLINSMCKARNMQRAMELFDQMCGRGLYPNQRTYTTLICGFSQQGCMVEAYELLNKMTDSGFSPSIVTYNALINGHCVLGRTEDALKVIEDMSQSGIVPDVVSYSTIMSGFCRNYDFDKAFEMKDQMVKKGVFPDNITYSTLIQGLCEQQKVSEACELFREMQKIGLQPDKHTYTRIINAYCSEGNISGALCLHDEMISEGFFPDVVTYRVLINGLQKQAHSREAKQLLFKLFYEESVPNDITYQMLIDSCSNLEFRNAADLIKSFCMKGLLNEADQVLERMLQQNQKPSEAVYNVLVHGHSRGGNLQKALNLYREMVGRGFIPHAVSVIALMKELSKEGKDRELKQVIQNTLSSCRLTDAEVAKVLVEVNFKEGNMDAVLNVLIEMAKDGLLPNSG